MNMKTISKVYVLKSNTDLTPGKGYVQGGRYITAIHCVKKPESVIKLRLLDDTVIEFMPDAFVAGAIYPYAIKHVNDEGAACFMGLCN